MLRSWGSDSHLLFCLIVMKTNILCERIRQMLILPCDMLDPHYLKSVSHNCTSNADRLSPAESPWYIKYNQLHFCAYIMLVRRGHHDDITAWCHGWLQCVQWHNVTLWRDIEINARATIWLQQHRRTASNFKSSPFRVYWVGGLWNRAVLS